MDFVAIDFETANEERGSACEVSLVRFENGVPTEKLTSFVFQERFSGFNTMLHGIDSRTVRDAPRFSDLWPSLREFIGSSPLVTHNAGFDLSVLFRSLSGSRVDAEIPYFCTMVISRRLLETSYFGLPGVTEHLGIEYPMDHRAENDAVAAGKVASALLRLGGAGDFFELSENLRIRPGLLTEKGPSGSFFVGQNTTLTAAEKEKILQELGEEELYVDPDFAGKNIVFTGELLSMKRRDAETAVLRAGGWPVSSVSGKTNMVVFGYQDPRKLKGKPLSSKRLKAEELRANGVEIEVVDELQFLEMLSDRGAYDRRGESDY